MKDYIGTFGIANLNNLEKLNIKTFLFQSSSNVVDIKHAKSRVAQGRGQNGVNVRVVFRQDDRLTSSGDARGL